MLADENTLLYDRPESVFQFAVWAGYFPSITGFIVRPAKPFSVDRSPGFHFHDLEALGSVVLS